MGNAFSNLLWNIFEIREQICNFNKFSGEKRDFIKFPSFFRQFCNLLFPSSFSLYFTSLLSSSFISLVLALWIVRRSEFSWPVQLRLSSPQPHSRSTFRQQSWIPSSKSLYRSNRFQAMPVPDNLLLLLLLFGFNFYFSFVWICDSLVYIFNCCWGWWIWLVLDWLAILIQSLRFTAKEEGAISRSFWFFLKLINGLLVFQPVCFAKFVGIEMIYEKFSPYMDWALFSFFFFFSPFVLSIDMDFCSLGFEGIGHCILK